MGTETSFDLARKEDLVRIAEIEDEFFPNYERKFTLEFLEEWFDHNPNMIYVVRDVKGIVQAFSVLVPVEKGLYERLLSGEVSDFFEFRKTEVPKDLSSPYYYLADICISKNVKGYLRIASKLMIGSAKVLYAQAERITTSPITDDGFKMCKHLGFKEVAVQTYNGEQFPIYELIVPKKSEELPKMFKIIFSKEG